MNSTTLEFTATTDVDGGTSNDPLELHFRKMSQFPLLTHAEELALARRLERADLSITRALLGCQEGREALLEIARSLRDHETRIEDVERNPNPEDEKLSVRIEQAVADATRKGPTRSRPRAHGLRIHPQALRPVVEQLGERSAREPKNAPLRAALEAIEKGQLEGNRATAEFIHANLRIVVTFARRYRGMPLVDLIQEGNLGLLRAVDKFDHRRGLRFSTYAAWWIRHALSRALADQSKMIRLPVHLTGTVQRVRRAEERLLRETGKEPTVPDLAARTGLPVEQVKRALEVVAQPISLETPTGGAGEREAAELGDFVADQSAQPADEAVAESELRDEARLLLAELPEREAEVIRLRYGLNGGAQRTLEEIGKSLSLSRERARQLERDALRKLRAASEKRRLRAHLTG
ncbi:RNA polymerase sigma factor RpoD/SigA [Labilithrix luteola]|nr:RNA polymerase sigma factor RpoD/SigA [Labilithrix luteola]